MGPLEKRTRWTGASGPSVSVATMSPVAVSTTVTANRRVPGLWSVVSIAARAPSAETIPYHASCFVANSRRGSAVPARSSAQSAKPEPSTRVTTAMVPSGLTSTPLTTYQSKSGVRSRGRPPATGIAYRWPISVPSGSSSWMIVRPSGVRVAPQATSAATTDLRSPVAPSHTKAPMPETPWTITSARSPVPRTGRNATGCDARNRARQPPFVLIHCLPRVLAGPRLRSGFAWAKCASPCLGMAGEASGLAAHRPGRDRTIQQLMADTGVSICLQGHDHLFARQELDGVVYQTLPSAADPNEAMPNAQPYQSGDTLPASGHLRVTVAPGGVMVDYVRSSLQRPDEVAFTYTVR